LTPEKTLGFVLTLLLLVFTGTYTFVYQNQQNRVADRDRMVEARDKQIESLQAAKTWDVPETIDRLNDISKKLQKQFSSMEEFEALRKENEVLRSEKNSLATQNAAVTSKLDEASRQNVLLKSSLEKIFATNQAVDLEEGKAIELVKNSLTLGLSTMYSDSTITGRLGNEYLSMTVGESKTMRVLGKDCRLTLVETRKPKASFVFSCS
jgi:TolA-binding protein